MSSADPTTGVRLLGDPGTYRDGAESELLGLMTGTTDRSSQSDELAAHIHDWPTRYHLSRTRRNLLDPLEISSEMTVLDVGAGTGTTARALGEAGCHVIALEPSLDRAKVAAARCSDLDNVEVVCGHLNDLDEGTFDLVTCIGVLEYAGSDAGGGQGPVAFLEQLTARVAPAGTLAVAIENQLGVKYLTGAPEDHLNEVMVGVEGYPEPASKGIRTFTRRKLSSLLDAAGLPSQHWLFPYPDYKLPSVILDEQAFEQLDAARLVDQLVGDPGVSRGGAPAWLANTRAVHQVYLDAGLGRDVANSFLVLARRSDVDAPVASDTLGWIYGGERVSSWLRRRRIIQDSPGSRTIETSGDVGLVRRCGWLTQQRERITPFVHGPTVEQLLLHALQQADTEQASAILTGWNRSLVRALSGPTTVARAHPFSPGDTSNALPGSYLDCNLDNFIQADDGTLTFFDQEWVADGTVDADMVRLRALRNAAWMLISTGAAHPWPQTATVDEITYQLCALADIAYRDDLVERLADAEAHLQHVVSGKPFAGLLQGQAALGARSRLGDLPASSVPLTRLLDQARGGAASERKLEEAQRLAGRLRGQLEASETSRDELRDQFRDQLSVAVEERDILQAELDHAAAVVAKLSARLADATGELTSCVQESADIPILQAELDKANRGIKELRGKLTAADNKIRVLAGEVEQARHGHHDTHQALQTLIQGARAVSGSRRWKWGNRLGDVIDGIRGTDRDEDVTATFNRHIAKATEALAAEPVTPKRSNEPKRPKIAADAPFRDFDSYLRFAMTNPELHPPFDEPAMRVFGVMDSRRRHLVEQSRRAGVDVTISVVMPTYNRAGQIREAIDSVLNQSYEHFELLIADDGSTDNTSDVVANYNDNRIVYLPSDTNQGVSAARNRALEAASGELVAYLDTDNTIHPDFLRVMAAALTFAGDQVMLAYCAQDVWATADNGERYHQMMRFGPFNRALLEHRNYIDQNTVVHRRSLVERYGGFDENLTRLVDWEQVLRYTQDGGALAVPCVLSVYETGGSARISSGDGYRDALAALDACQHPAPSLCVPEHIRDDQAPIIPVASSGPRAGTPRPVATIIPSFEAYDCLKLCIEQVQATTSHLDHRLIVVDNGSSDPVRQMLAEFATNDERITVELAEGNFGFTWAVNRGIELAGDRDVVLLNNDAVVTDNWLEAFFEVLDEVHDAGLVVPRQVLFPGTKTMKIHVPFSRQDRELDVNLSWHHHNIRTPEFDAARGFVELAFAPFFCVYIPRDVINDIGPLDVENGPHYRSDRLYCEMVTKFAGRRIIYTPHAKLYHFLQQATSNLKRDDPAGYQRMFIDNDWSKVKDAASRS